MAGWHSAVWIELAVGRMPDRISGILFWVSGWTVLHPETLAERRADNGNQHFGFFSIFTHLPVTDYQYCSGTCGNFRKRMD